MHLSPFTNRSTLLFTALLIATGCFSQPKTSIGLNLTGEHASSADFVAGFGGTFETAFSKHHGIETGLYYRTYALHSQVFVDGSLYATFSTKEQYVSIPVLYKFRSPVLNFSAGPTFDIYTGRKQGTEGPSRYDPAPTDRKFQVGLLGKIGKTVGITKKLFVEPEIRYNPIFYQWRSYYGIGIGFKYALAN